MKTSRFIKRQIEKDTCQPKPMKGVGVVPLLFGEPDYGQ